MRLLPIVFVRNAEESIRFYTTLGLDLGFRTDQGDWAELVAEGGTLALHSQDAADTPHPVGAVELCFEASEPLEVTASRLTDAGFAEFSIHEEDFGRSLRITDPDGRKVQINESPDIQP